MSAPERAPLAVSALACELFEVAALRGRWAQVEQAFAARALQLPAPLGVTGTEDHLLLRVRPARVLVLSEPGSPQADFTAWQAACESAASVVDLSGACVALQLPEVAGRAVLPQGCRLDLRAQAFPAGSAAATVLAQVPVIVAALPAQLLLLAPATVSRHVQDWLRDAGESFEPE